MRKPLSVAVIGGGIGGLFAANALLARGFAASVHEQAPGLGEIGAGVYVTPNSVRQMQRIGLGAAVPAYGARVSPQSCYRRQDGSHIAPVQTADADGWQAAFGMHRADFIEFLAAALPAGVVHCGRRAVDYREDAHSACVAFDNGDSVTADVIVAADGIHSALRPFVYPPSTPVFHGTASYRGLVARDRLKDWPADRWEMWAGSGKHFLVFPVRGGALLNYVGFVPADEAIKESWSAPGDPEALRRAFEGWDPRVGQILGAVGETFQWALYDREPLPRWSKGRLTMLGDAAHPMLPHLGQGANQAIEDGMALATILAKANRATVPSALVIYEKLRRTRVADIQRGARENGLRVESLANYADTDRRDAELRAHADFRKRLYSYDVAPAAEAAAEALIEL